MVINRISRRKKWQHPVATEREYKIALVRCMDEYIREVKNSLESIELTGVRQDGLLDDLEIIFNHLKAAQNSIFGQQISALPKWFTRVSTFNDRQWRRVVKVGTGFDIPASREVSGTGLGINAYRSEPWLDTMQSAWVSNNTDLIKTLPEKLDADIKQIVKSGVVNGASADTLRKEIQEKYGNSRYRAELIAVDQIQKANAALAEQRQRDVGVTHYIWEGVMDQRERATHKAREGQEFAWDSPPPDGHPGQPVRCRCTASPSWKGTVFDIGED